MENNCKGYSILKKFALITDRLIEEQVIPIHDIEAFAGFIESFADGYIPMEQIVLPDLPKCDGGMYVRGDSMFPLLNPGDIVVFKITESRRGGLNFGSMHLLAFNIDEQSYIAVKYLHESKKQGHYTLLSHNSNYEPMEVPVNNVRIIAIIKASVKYN